MKKGLYITLAILALIVMVVVGKYNGFVSKEEQIDSKWAEIDNQLKRRSELIPNLVETVKGYATHEKEIIDSLTNARAQLAGAKTPEEKLQANGELTGALNRLLVVAESNPQLRANESFNSLMDSLEGTENRLTVARKNYNEEVNSFNKSIKTFPGNALAGMFGFDEKPYFEVTETEKEAPKVDFGGSNWWNDLLRLLFYFVYSLTF